MAVNYDLNNTGPEVQSRLDQVFPNKSDIDTLGVRVDGHDADIAELNNEIDALERQDVIPVDTLPSVSEADPKTIYRVAAEDSYTDYMVNASGDGWKELAEFSFPGIDEEPTDSSNNLVKSGGVLKSITKTYPYIGPIGNTVQTATGVAYANEIFFYIPANTPFLVEILGDSGILTDNTLGTLFYIASDGTRTSLRSNVVIGSQFNFVKEFDIYGFRISRGATGVVGVGNITIKVSVPSTDAVKRNNYTRYTNIKRKIN